MSNLPEVSIKSEWESLVLVNGRNYLLQNAGNHPMRLYEGLKPTQNEVGFILQAKEHAHITKGVYEFWLRCKKPSQLIIAEI